ncbi:MAG TPA: hypothetical protein VMT82_09355 [candidate division Zixibacteria bacterium]|nr:hypothetical protein [Candidatus Acidoferrales bacterium]HVP65091.1 hypothetical protein [candidate division Zixibacteria bacterium]
MYSRAHQLDILHPFPHNIAVTVWPTFESPSLVKRIAKALVLGLATFIPGVFLSMPIVLVWFSSTHPPSADSSFAGLQSLPIGAAVSFVCTLLFLWKACTYHPKAREDR